MGFSNRIVILIAIMMHGVNDLFSIDNIKIKFSNR